MPTKMPEVQKEPLVDKDDIPANKSGNRPFTDVLQAHISRRKVLTGSLAVAGATFLAPATVSALGRGVGLSTAPGKSKDGLVGFEPLSIEEATAGEGRMVTVSPDYEYQTLIPWGTPIKPGVPEYTGTEERPASEDAENQIGIGHDGMWFFPETARWGRQNNKRGILCINHEYGTNDHVLGKRNPESLEDVRLSQAVHGVSVVEIQEKGGKWDVVLNSPFNRRITPNTEMEFSGPVVFESGSLIYDEGATPLGTANNCGSGPTPWGTYVTCEENFDGYFGVRADSPDKETWEPTENQRRYSVTDDAGRYGWCNFDGRFDLSNPDYANEHLRFGWCVEIDPRDPSKKPIKRTAMGRFKHESAAFAELANGRVAVYMGDDQQFDYCYKYVSEKPWRDHVADGDSPLDFGTLYVARFDEFGGEWLELSTANPDLEEWTQEEILVFSRVAADVVGATPMDRPEWTTIGKDGEVYWTLTNNTGRLPVSQGGPGPDFANPIAEPGDPTDDFDGGGNQDGHIIRTVDTSDTTFDWEIFILAKDTRGSENVFTDPDSAWADPFGRLFIGTDGGQPDGLQDQMVVFDAETGEYKRLLMGVQSDEITGITTTPNYRTMFTNTQHPGNGDPTRTNFPAPFDGVTIPRDCTIVVTRKNKGIVGS